MRSAVRISDFFPRKAPWHTIHETDHFHVIRFNGLTYPSFPKKPQIDVGHIRKMAGRLGILDCAKKFCDWK